MSDRPLDLDPPARRASRHRLGVALTVPEPNRTEIAGLRRGLGLHGPGRMPPHVTLCGPVNVRADEFDAVRTRLADVAVRQSPIEVHLGPASSFAPVDSPVFLEVNGPVADLRRLVHQPPLVRDDRPFVPHVTVAPRTADAAALAARLAYDGDVVFDALDLYEQTHDDDGIDRWHLIDQFRFSPRAVIGRGGFEIVLTEHVRTSGIVEIIARHDDAAVGRALLWLPGRQVITVEVVPAARRAGIGRQLFLAADARLASAGDVDEVR